MLTLVVYTIAVALAAAFCLALVRKWGWLEWMQVHSNGFFNQLLNCHFCTTFWATFLITAAAVCVVQWWPLCFCPILATTIAVRLW